MSKIYYHYCSLETLIHIIKDKKIRLCNIGKMNDEQECIDIEKILLKIIADEKLDKSNPEILDLVRTYRDYRDDRHMPYIACFSEENDRLSQWRAYANDGEGVCIGFDFEDFEDMEEQSPSLVTIVGTNLGYSKVIYSIDEKKGIIDESIKYFIEVMKKAKNDFGLMQTLNDAVSNRLLKNTTIFKNQAFEEEAEYRIIYLPLTNSVKEIDLDSNDSTLVYLKDTVELKRNFYAKKDTIVGFYEYPFKAKAIKNIVLGPKCKLDSNDIDLKNLLKDNHIEAKIYKSKASYR